MTVNWRHGISALAALGVLGALSGCTSGLVSAADYDYDFDALDSYLVDRDDVELPYVKPAISPSGSGTATSGSSSSVAVGSHRISGKVSAASWSAEDLVGDWTGTIGMSRENQTFESTGDPKADAMMREMGDAMSGMLSGMMQMSLALRNDGTFTMVMVMLPIEGTWFVDGHTISLQPKMVMGMTSDQMLSQDPSLTKDDWESLDLTVMEDGTLEAVDPDDPTSVTIFVRN